MSNPLQFDFLLPEDVFATREKFQTELKRELCDEIQSSLMEFKKDPNTSFVAVELNDDLTHDSVMEVKNLLETTGSGWNVEWFQNDREGDNQLIIRLPEKKS